MSQEGKKADSLGSRIVRLREAAGLTRVQLAERLGIQREALSRWENNRIEPSWTNIQALAKALGVDCTAFVVESGSAEPTSSEPKKNEEPTPEPKKKRGK